MLARSGPKLPGSVQSRIHNLSFNLRGYYFSEVISEYYQVGKRAGANDCSGS